jgi:predicted transposase YbfD/YdcC
MASAQRNEEACCGVLSENQDWKPEAGTSRHSIQGRDLASGETVEVVVGDGVIEAIAPISSGEERWLSPGFIDLQINGYCGQDLNDESLTPEVVIALAQQLVALGVTTFLPTLITSAEGRLVAALRAIAAARHISPQAAHMIPHAAEWDQLSSLVRIQAERYHKATGKTERETRYYISSLKPNAKRLNAAIRQHWGIENKLHWILDVAFGEDLSRKRAGHAAENFSLLNRIALSLLKQDKTSKIGIHGKRLQAAWDHDYLLHLLGIDKQREH